MTPAEFEKLNRDSRLAALKAAQDSHGIDSDIYRKLANKHIWLLKQRSYGEEE